MEVPSQFRSKIGNSDIQIDDVKIKATLVSIRNLQESHINELKSLVDKKLPVVGVDFKQYCSVNSVVRYTYSCRTNIVSLYVKDRCLTINQLSVDEGFPEFLRRFFNNKTICFVGLKIDTFLDKFRNMITPPETDQLTAKGAEIRNLAAAILKDNSLAQCASVTQLASMSGLMATQGSDQGLSDSAMQNKYFTDEEMKWIVADAYRCYVMGTKLLAML